MATLSTGAAGPSLDPNQLPADERIANELRAAAAAWQDETPQPQIRLIQATEELPVEQPTVVPRNFGQPPPEMPFYGGEDSEYAAAEYGHAWPGAHPARRHFSWFRLPIHWFGHRDPNDPYRHAGMGEPLIGTSWRNRPWYFGLFVGGVLNDDLRDDSVLQNNSTFLGVRLGWDFDHYWGLEGRYAYARAEILDGSNVPLAEPARDYYGDLSLLYYPWGDARWRPYLSAGVGFANYRFIDDGGFAINDSALTLPFGVGLKCFYDNWFTIRFDLVDNFAIGTNQLSSMHNVALMAGVEFRFGGRRPSYFPWHGNTSYW